MSNKKEFRLAEQWKKLLLIPILVFVVGLGCMLGFGLTGNGALNLASDLNGGTVIDVTVGTAMTEENRDDVVGIATDLLDELGFAVTEDIRAAGEIGTEAAGFTIIGRVTAGEGQTRDEAVEAFNSGLIGSVDEGTGLRNQIYNYLTEHASEGQTVNRMNITVHSSQAEGSLPWQQVLFFGLTVLVPAVRRVFGGSGYSVLAVSLVLGMMILPTVVSVSADALAAVEAGYYEGARALGAGHERSVFRVLLPAARSGISAAVTLGLGRAIGESMAVVMVAGNQAVFPHSPLDGARTLTSNIVLEMGYASGLHADALIATGVVLFAMVMLNNLIFALLRRRRMKK